jgi:hypothetical protein
LDVPLAKQADRVLLTSCDDLPANIENGSILLSNRLGETLIRLQPSKFFPNSFITPLIIPEVDFRILTTIDLISNTRLQRQTVAVISPTLISIEIANQSYILIANNSINIITSMTTTT